MTEEDLSSIIWENSEYGMVAHPVLSNRYFVSPSLLRIKNKRVLLWTTRYLPSCTEDEVKGIVFYVHGYGEHCGRLEHLYEFLNRKNYAVFTFDQAGHGHSHGPKGKILDINYLAEDLRYYIKNVVYENLTTTLQRKPMFLIGSSMGGLVITTCLLRYYPTESYEDIIKELASEIKPNDSLLPRITGVVLYSPLFGFLSDGLVSRFFTKTFCPLMGDLPLVYLNPSTLTKDRSIIRQYKKDPLVYHGMVSLKTLKMLVIAYDRVFRLIRDHDSGKSDAEALSYREKGICARGVFPPMIVFHGSADTLVDPQSTKSFVTQALCHTGHDVLVHPQVSVIPGGYHELLTEESKDQVMKATLSFMENLKLPKM